MMLCVAQGFATSTKHPLMLSVAHGSSTSTKHPVMLSVSVAQAFAQAQAQAQGLCPYGASRLPLPRREPCSVMWVCNP